MQIPADGPRLPVAVDHCLWPRLARIWARPRDTRFFREIWRLAAVGDDGVLLFFPCRSRPEAAGHRACCGRNCHLRGAVQARSHPLARRLSSDTWGRVIAWPDLLAVEPARLWHRNRFGHAARSPRRASGQLARCGALGPSVSCLARLLRFLAGFLRGFFGCFLRSLRCWFLPCGLFGRLFRPNLPACLRRPFCCRAFLPARGSNDGRRDPRGVRRTPARGMYATGRSPALGGGSSAFRASSAASAAIFAMSFTVSAIFSRIDFSL